MDDEHHYGSSEYSEEAEELFASYVLRRESGERVDFEEFCAHHEARADELYGLHTDWDNVSSLLGRLGLRKTPPPPEEPPDRVPDLAGEVPSRGAPVWKWLSGVGLAAAIAVGAFAWSLYRSNEVLAQDKSVLQTRSEVLEEGSSQLSLELESERGRAESAEESVRQATTRGAWMALRLAVTALQEEERSSRPASPSRLPALESWLERASELHSRIDPLRSDFQALSPGSEDLTLLEALIEELEALESEGGTRDRVLRRVEMLHRVAGETSDTDRSAWRAAIEELADVERSPVYGGLTLEPHFPLVPVGREPLTGLWCFADRRTGRVPGWSDDGVFEIGPECALIFLLHPGGIAEGEEVSPFWIATSPLRPEHLERAAVGLEREELGYAAPTWIQSRLTGMPGHPVLAMSAIHPAETTKDAKNAKSRSNGR
jgi:hypothetical protein